MLIQTNLRRVLATCLACVAFAASSNTTQAKDNAFETVYDGVEAYVYGYSLVTMEITCRIMTDVREPEGSRAPMGQFVRMRHDLDAVSGMGGGCSWPLHW